jgi:hypothetical protein
MKRSLLVGLALGMLSGGQTLTVRLYNLANLPTTTVERASILVEELFAGAGINVTCQKGFPGSLEGRLTDMSAVTPGIRRESDSRDYLIVRFLSGVPADPSSRTELGYALPFARQGAHVTVYRNTVEKLYLSSAVMPSFESLLGAAMAHEIGHVLLGSEEHFPHGIMKARWGRAEFQSLACKRLHFMPEESAGLRAGAYRRTEAVCAAGAVFFSSASINGFRNCN